MIRQRRNQTLIERDVFRSRAEGPAVALAVEQPDALAWLEARHTGADLIDNAGAVAVWDHARELDSPIGAAAAIDIGRVDGGRFEPNSHLARAGRWRRHFAGGQDLGGGTRTLIPDRLHTEARYSVPGKAPPSSRMFCPVMKPALAPHRNAQNSPNSSGSPKRPDGFCLARSASIWSGVIPRLSASALAVPRRRSVANGPGSSPLMVTLLITVLRAMPATKPVSPARAPLESPRISIGALTAAEVMLTMRPNLRAIM